MSLRERWLAPVAGLGADDADWAGPEAVALAAGRRKPAAWVLGPGAVWRVLDANGLALAWADLRDEIRRDAPGWEPKAAEFAERLRAGRVPHGLASALEALPGELLVFRAAGLAGPLAEREAAGGDRVEALLEALASLFEPAGHAAALEAGLDPRELVLNVRVSRAPELDAGPAEPAVEASSVTWVRLSAAERFPDPVSPLGFSILQGGLGAGLALMARLFGIGALPPEAVARPIGGYVYHNRDFFALRGGLALVPRFWLRRVPWLAGLALRCGPGLLARRGGPLFGDRLGHPRQRALAAAYGKLVFEPAAILEAEWAEGLEDRLAALSELAARSPETMDAPARRAHAAALSEASAWLRAPELALDVIKAACRGAVEALADLALGPEPDRILRLTDAGAAHPVLAFHGAIAELAEAARAEDPALAALLAGRERDALAEAWAGSSLRARRHALLARYGHLGLSPDLLQPPLAERPALLDAWLGQRLTAGSPRLVDRAEAEAARVRAALAGHPGALAFFERALSTLRRVMALEATQQMAASRAVPAQRRLFLIWGEALAGRGLLARADDVFFLELGELTALLDAPDPFSLARLAHRRRRAFEAALGSEPPPVVKGDRPVPVESGSAGFGAGRREVAGRPAGGGIAEGRVRRVTNLVELGAFLPGEIAVVSAPMPAVSPVFAVAAGVVAAAGGSLAPSLVAARAYGLPVLTDAPEALIKLRTGSRARLDAVEGRATLFPASEG